jgi:hypothetical protein
MPDVRALLPGLERPFEMSAGAKDFEPEAHDAKLSVSMDQCADGRQADVTLRMYNELLFKYNTEVPYLGHQVVELTNRVAELETWRLQTMSTIRSLRDQLKTLQSKTSGAVLAPTGLVAFEQKTSEAWAPPTRICTAPPSVPVLRDSSADEGCPSAPRGSEEGLRVYKSSMDIDSGLDGLQTQVDTMRVEWNIRNFFTKLKQGMGRPLVSPPFDLWGLEQVRLMVLPMAQESSGPRSRKEKEQFTKMLSDGPVDAALMLKVPNARQCLVKYHLGVGKQNAGPYECDFSNTAIDNRGSFGINWRFEVDKDSSITVSMEMLPPPSEKLEGEEIRQELLAVQDEERPPLPDQTFSPPPGLPAPTEAMTDKCHAHGEQLSAKVVG